MPNLSLFGGRVRGGDFTWADVFHGDILCGFEMEVFHDFGAGFNPRGGVPQLEWRFFH